MIGYVHSPKCISILQEDPFLFNEKRSVSRQVAGTALLILSAVDSEDARRRILSNINAMEGFVLFSGIAMGILQLISLSDEFNKKIRKSRYLRTPSRENPSEATVMYYLRRTIFLLMQNSPDSLITEIIRSKQEKQSGTRLKKTG